MDQKFILVTLVTGIIVLGVILYYLSKEYNSKDLNSSSSETKAQPKEIKSLIEAYESLQSNKADYSIVNINKKNFLLFKLSDERITKSNSIESKEYKHNISKFFKHHINNIYNIYVNDVEVKSLNHFAKEKDSQESKRFYFVPNSYDSNIFHNLTDTNSIKYILNEVHSSRLYEYFCNFIIRYIYILDNIGDLLNTSNIKKNSVKQCYRKAEDLKLLFYDLVTNEIESESFGRLIDVFKTTTISDVVQSRKTLENGKNQIKKIIMENLQRNAFLANTPEIKHNEGFFSLIDYFYFILISYEALIL